MINPMISTDYSDLQLVDDFNRNYGSAKTARSKTRALQQFCEQIQTTHRALTLDAQAVATVVRYHRQKEQKLRQRTRNEDHEGDEDADQDDPINSEEWQLVKELAARTKSLNELSHRQRLALKTVVALWSLEKVQYYHWTQASYEFLEAMIKVAGKEPAWDGFVQRANRVMIARHEKSLHSNRSQYIGGHNGRSCVKLASSPLETSDLVAMHSESEEHQRDQELRVERQAAFALAYLVSMAPFQGRTEMLSAVPGLEVFLAYDFGGSCRMIR